MPVVTGPREYNRATYMNASTLFLVLAVVFFLIATLIAGGVVTTSAAWFLPAGLVCLALAFLL